MSIEDLREELEELRDALNAVQLENERLLDEREGLLESAQLDGEKAANRIEEKYAKQIADLRATAEKEITTLSHEVDLFRKAATGDSSGWRKEVNKYINETTGEESTEAPAVYTIATAVRNLDNTESRAFNLRKAELKAQATETKRRQLEIDLHECKSALAAQRQVVTTWTTAAGDIHSALLDFDKRMKSKVIHRLDEASEKLGVKADLVSEYEHHDTTMKTQVIQATKDYTRTKKELSTAKSVHQRLEIEKQQLQDTISRNSAKLKLLTTDFEGALSRELDPMRLEVARCYDTMTAEKLKQRTERQQLAALWPKSHLVPLVLRRCLPLDAESRERLVNDALAAEADADLKREIRRRCAEATRWSQLVDDYGRQYYVHADTGEASWEPPEAMLYEPPPGRDELGNVVVAKEASQLRLGFQATTLDDSHKTEYPTPAPKPEHSHEDPSNWEQSVDTWGRKLWKHRATGRTRTTDPNTNAPALNETKKKVFLTADEHDDEFSSGEDEALPTTAASSRFFLDRLKTRKERDERRRRKAIAAARRVLIFLEEKALKYRNQRDPSQESHMDADAPLLVDYQAIKELASGDDNWFWMSRQARRELELEREAERLRVEKEAQARTEARKNDIRKALELRQQTATGLSKKLKKDLDKRVKNSHKKAPKSPTKSTLAQEKKVSSLDGVTHSSIPTKTTHTIPHCEAYYLLEGSPHGSVLDEEAGTDFTIEDLRKELENNARAEEEILAQLAATRKRLETVSLHLLRLNRDAVVTEAEVIPSNHQLPCESLPPPNEIVTPDSNTDQTPRQKDKVADSEALLAKIRGSITEKLAPPSERIARLMQSIDTPEFCAQLEGTMPLPLCGPQMLTMRAAHLMAAEAVWSGLNGIKLKQDRVLYHIRDLQNTMTEGQKLDLSVVYAFFQSESSALLDDAKDSAENASIVKSVARRTVRRRETVQSSQHEAVALGAAAAEASAQLACTLIGHGAASTKLLAKAQESTSNHSTVLKHIMTASKIAKIGKMSPEFQEAIEAVKQTRFLSNVLQSHLEDNAVRISHDTNERNETQDTFDTTGFAAKFNAEFRSASSYQAKVAQLLDLALENKLPEQIAHLALSQSATDENTSNAFLDMLHTERRKSDEDPSENKIAEKSASRILHAPSRLLDEAAQAHERVMDMLFGQVSRMGQEAWRNHSASLESLNIERDRLQRLINRMADHENQIHQGIRSLEMQLKAAAHASIDQTDKEGMQDEQLLSLRKSDSRRLKMRICRLKDRQSFIKTEIASERERGSWLETTSRHVAAVRAAHLNERDRQMHTLIRLQTSLHTALNEYVNTLHEIEVGNVNYALEAQAAARLSFVRLREKFREEGRRRRWLREEELSFFRTDFRRLADDRAVQVERKDFLELCLKANSTCDAAIDAHNAENVAMIAADSAHLFPCIRVLEDRLAASYANLALVESSRRNARIRESRQRLEYIAITRAAAKLVAPFPALDSSNLAIADDIDVTCINPSDLLKTDAITAAVLLRYNRANSLSDQPGTETTWATSATFLELARQDIEAAWLSAQRSAEKADSEALARLRDRDSFLNVISKVQMQVDIQRQAGTHLRKTAVESGLHAAATIKQVANNCKDLLLKERAAAHRAALRDNRKRDEAESKFNALLSEAKEKADLSQAMTAAMRYGLSCEVARRRIADKKLIILTENMAKLRGRCNDEIRCERAHSARIELWVYALISAFAFFRSEIAHREKLLDHQQNIDKRTQRKLRRELWQQNAAVHTIGLDVNALLLFFAQRLAALSGAHQSYNDAIRSNGALLILAALCQSPRQELRQLGAKALANLTWDGHTDRRSLGLRIKDEWNYWSSLALEREKLRLQSEAESNTFEPTDLEGRLKAQYVETIPSEKEFSRMTPREVAVARRQWALRHRRACEGPNLANMRILASPSPGYALLGMPVPDSSSTNSNQETKISSADEKMTAPPLVSSLLLHAHERDHDSVVSAAIGLASASYDPENAHVLGAAKGILEVILRLIKHENALIVALACDAIANLTFGQETNQELFGSSGVIEILVNLLRNGPAACALEQFENSTPYSVHANTDGAETAFDTDVAEAAACALANALSLHVPNATRLVKADGLQLLFNIINSPLTVNLLDVDQTLEIQTNAANALANAAANLGAEGRSTLIATVQCLTVAHSDQEDDVTARNRSPVAALVLLCASQLVQAKIAAALLIGNLACDDFVQTQLGNVGAMDALWLIATELKSATQTTCALWAMSNLVWAHIKNQDRLTNILEGIVSMAKGEFLNKESVQSDWYATRICAVNLIANGLHYHDTNRRHIEIIPEAIDLLINFCDKKHENSMRQAALRCMISLTATDRGARRVMAAREDNGRTACLALITAAGDATSGGALSRVRRYGTIALANLCIYTEARLEIQTVGGLEILVSAAACDDKMTRNSAAMALEALQENIGRSERSKPRIRPSAGRLGAKSLVGLLKATPSERTQLNRQDQEAGKMAKHFAAERLFDAQKSADGARMMGAESLEEGSEWLEPGNLDDFVIEGGIEALIGTLSQYSSDLSTHSDLLIVTLDALYNCVSAHGEKDHDLRQRISNVRGAQIFISIARAASISSPRILQAALRALVPIATGYAPICRTLLAISLDFLLDIAENDNQPATDMPAVASEHRELASILLRQLAPHNLILCTNCSTKNRGGLVCVFCGHALLIENAVDDSAIPPPQQKKQPPNTSAKLSLPESKATTTQP